MCQPKEHRIEQQGRRFAQRPVERRKHGGAEGKFLTQGVERRDKYHRGDERQGGDEHFLRRRVEQKQEYNSAKKRGCHDDAVEDMPGGGVFHP